jgi:hypothetical protein
MQFIYELPPRNNVSQVTLFFCMHSRNLSLKLSSQHFFLKITDFHLHLWDSFWTINRLLPFR